MTDTATSLPSAPRSLSVRDWLPWVFIGCGIFTMPAIFLLGYLLGTDSSRSQPIYETPIEIIGLCCCALPAFFTRLAIWLRFVVSVAALLGFGFMYGVCVIIVLAIYGIPGC
jgi:hypothetical protein